jgi:hypothetical protein
MSEQDKPVEELRQSLTGDEDDVERDIALLRAALQEVERRGVEKMIAALVASPYSERILYTRAEDWYEAVAARLLSQKEEGQSPIIIDPTKPALSLSVTTEGRRAPDALVEVEPRIREYLAFSHQDGKCNIYTDDGELQCANLARHGRTIDFRREPIGDLLDIIIDTRQREYVAALEGEGR